LSEPTYDFEDGEGVTGPDPGEALVPGSPDDGPHRPQRIDPLHPDFVVAAEVPTATRVGGRHVR
jgi:hypothetical protein